MSDNPGMSFDPLVTNPGRLRILTELASAQAQPFVELRRRTGLTDGNLATHARRLQSAGLIAIDKRIDAGKPLTTIHLTSRGREALGAHVRTVMAALEPNSADPDETTPAPVAAQDDWVD